MLGKLIQNYQFSFETEYLPCGGYSEGKSGNTERWLLIMKLH